jgi:hypothetical protein
LYIIQALYLRRRAIGNGVAAELSPHHSPFPKVLQRLGGRYWRNWQIGQFIPMKPSPPVCTHISFVFFQLSILTPWSNTNDPYAKSPSCTSGLAQMHCYFPPKGRAMQARWNRRGRQVSLPWRRIDWPPAKAWTYNQEGQTSARLDQSIAGRRCCHPRR